MARDISDWPDAVFRPIVPNWGLSQREVRLCSMYGTIRIPMDLNEVLIIQFLTDFTQTTFRKTPNIGIVGKIGIY